MGLGIWPFAGELDPALLESRVMFRGFDQVQEATDRVLESLAQLRVRESSRRVEGLVRLREREHVGVHACAQVFQWDAKGPEAAIAAAHGGRGGQQKTLLAVQRLRAE